MTAGCFMPPSGALFADDFKKPVKLLFLLFLSRQHCFTRKTSAIALMTTT
jgi:hypothetical protein